MSLQHKFRALLLGAVFQVGAMIGVPMRPDEIEELMRKLNPARVEIAVTEERDEELIRRVDTARAARRF